MIINNMINIIGLVMFAFIIIGIIVLIFAGLMYCVEQESIKKDELE
jgi:hypothetical protein